MALQTKVIEELMREVLSSIKEIKSETCVVPNALIRAKKLFTMIEKWMVVNSEKYASDADTVKDLLRLLRSSYMSGGYVKFLRKVTNTNFQPIHNSVHALIDPCIDIKKTWHSIHMYLLDVIRAMEGELICRGIRGVEKENIGVGSSTYLLGSNNTPARAVIESLKEHTRRPNFFFVEWSALN